RNFCSGLVGTDVFRWQKKDDLTEMGALEYIQSKLQTIKVAVTGASGNIGYALLFRSASGEMFGKNQRVEINAYDLPSIVPKVSGVSIELYDCAFPSFVFDDIDVALLMGSKPSLKGIERNDLIRNNVMIFMQQGKALNEYARKSVKVCVVDNPANTNCLILANNASDIPLNNVTVMTRIDHDIGIA
ncbi:malate dehydrogenase family protein, partial [Reticulomyxa filosa]